MSRDKKGAELRERIQKRINKVEEELDFKNGCPWCYRKVKPGEEFCCKEHEHEFYKYNRRKKND